LRSGTAYLLSQPYSKDEGAMRSSSPQISNLQAMYDLYHRRKSARMKRAAQSAPRNYNPPVNPQKAHRQRIQPALRQQRAPAPPSKAVPVPPAIEPSNGSSQSGNYVHTF